MKVIVFHSNLGCEVAPAAFLKSINEKLFITYSHAPKVSESTVREFISEIKAEEKETIEVVFLGSYLQKYFKNIISELSTKFTVTRTQVYLFGAMNNEIDEDLHPYSGNDNNIGPCKYIFNYMMDLLSKNVVNFPALHPNTMRAMSLFDDRIFNRNMENNQILFTGLFNIDATKNLMENITNLFKNPTSLVQTEKKGRKILDSQLMVVRDRVKNNSKIVTLDTGVRAAITEATEFVNMTHQELRRVHQTDMTLIFFHELNNNAIRYSIRSWIDTINAQEYGKLIGGDGNKSSAGGQVDYDLELPWSKASSILYTVDGNVINESER